MKPMFRTLPTKCEACTDPTKALIQTTGPETFGKTKSRFACRNYECQAFSEYHLYPGESMPEPPKEEPKAEAAEPEKPAKPATATKKTTAKKTTSKKAAKK